MEPPESVNDCVYFTRRKFAKGSAIAWALRKPCPKCSTPMKKPNKRSPVYACPKCKHEEPKEEHEESLTINVEYECPECGSKGETTTPYKRKSWQGVKAFVFQCNDCKAKIGLTKKMAQPKS